MEYFSVNNRGETLCCKDLDDQAFALGCLGGIGDVLTTYSPLNAKRIMEHHVRGDTIACCSDLAVNCAVNNAEGDPTVMREALRGQRTRGVEYGGFRKLSELDLAHFALQAEWRQPEFTWSCDYFINLAKGAWVQNYPLGPFMDFFGIDRVYGVLTIARWIDFRRFAVVPGDVGMTYQVFTSYMDPPDMETYNAVMEYGVLETLNDPRTLPKLHRWLTAVGSWTINCDEHTILRRLHQQCRTAYADEPEETFGWKVACEMTRMCIDFLYIHHRWLLTGEGFDPYQFFQMGQEVADEYNRKFPPGYLHL